jgi:N-methylhydantoinase A
MSRQKPKRLGIDVGGTYTDLVVFDENTKELLMGKVPSTPKNPAEGVINGIKALGIDLSELEMIVHGTTIGVNTVIQKKGAKTGLLTTYGFHDVLEIGTMSKPDMYNLFYRKPRPLVPREYRIGIHERMTFEGEVLVDVDPDEVREKVKYLIDEGVNSIAISTLHSYANPENERKIAALIRREYPDMYVSVSHEIANQRREFERTSTTVLNAYIAPVAETYFRRLEANLQTLGFEGVVFIMKSNGGAMDLATASKTPVHTLLSGPVAGGIAGKALGDALANSNVITFDMGGTSCDISVILEGEPQVTFEAEVEGYPIMTPMVKINYLGAGGGSMAKIVGERSLRVGPESAGADPGPACYGIGGEFPTVTDANLILGRLDAGGGLAGGINLDRDLAIAAVKKHVADPLNMTVEEAALGIVEVACVKMAYAIREVTIEQGLDPKDFALISFGGAGSLHTPFICEMVGIRKIIVPWSPGTLCSWGMLNTNLRHDVVRTIDYGGRSLAEAEMSEIFGQLEAEGARALTVQGIGNSRITTQRSIDMRYRGQEHTLTISLSAGSIDAASLTSLRERYDQTHERRYAHSSPQEPVEFVNVRVEAVGELDKPGLYPPPSLSQNSSAPLPAVIRDVHFKEGLLSIGIYERTSLPVGAQINGPAIINETGSTTVLPPRHTLTVDALGNLVIDVPEGDGG